MGVFSQLTNPDSFVATLGVERIRLRGAIRLFVGFVLVPLSVGALIGLIAWLGQSMVKATVLLFLIPAVFAFAFIPWGMAELLTGKQWEDNHQVVRLLFLVFGNLAWVVGAIALAGAIG